VPKRSNSVPKGAQPNGCAVEESTAGPQIEPDLGHDPHVVSRERVPRTSGRPPDYGRTVNTTKVEQQRIASHERVTLALATMAAGLESKRLDHEQKRDRWAVLFGLVPVAVGFALVVTGHQMAGSSLLVFGGITAGRARRLFLHVR
jgi:hypothetical protein